MRNYQGPIFVLALWRVQDIINPVIIDIHSHIYPDHLAAGTVARVCERSRIRAYADGTLQGLRHSMKMAGIDTSVVSSVATKLDQVELIHKWFLGLRQPGILTLATTHPDLPVDRGFVEALKAQGFKGFKVHPDYQNFFADEERMYPFYEAAQSAGMFVLFHAGVDRGLPDPVHATPGRLAKVHEVFPNLPMIAAHMGGESMYEETERYLLGEDIYLDTSFVLQKMPLSIIERFFKNHPVERFLFGSDSPWTDQGEEIQFLLSLPFISEEGKERIISTNAARLLGLS